jgi:hypothetical protein
MRDERFLESVIARFAESWAAGDEGMAQAWAEIVFTQADVAISAPGDRNTGDAGA